MMFHSCKGLGINGSSMTDLHREQIFLDFLRFRQSFSLRTLPQTNVLFFIYPSLGGVKTTSTSHHSRYMDGWIPLKLVTKHPIYDPFRLLSWSFLKLNS